MLIAVLLVWLVVTRSFAAYLAYVDPEAALGFQPSNPTALLSLATSELRLQTASTSSEPPETSSETTPKEGSVSNSGQQEELVPRNTAHSSNDIRRAVVTALINDPLNARAFNLLGQLSENESETEKFMKAAVRRSLHQRAPLYWMMISKYEEENFSEALSYADTLLRTRPQTLGLVMPVLGKIAELPEMRGELKKLLKDDPPWRSAFFASLPRNIADARTPFNLLADLASTPSPPTADDFRSYISFLIKHQFFDLAYYVWLQFLPSEQLRSAGHVFNGGFDSPNIGLPFDWTFAETPGATIKVSQPKPDASDDNAMFLEFGPGRVNFGGVRQLVLLAPGHYRLTGQQKLDIMSQRGLKWEVRCTHGTLIGESTADRGTRPEWEEFGLDLIVPKRDCPAQYVQLIFDARSASERFISGTAWYDDLKIERQAHGAPNMAGSSDATNPHMRDF